MILDTDYIIFASIVILLILPFYLYRREVFKKLYKNDSLEYFSKDLEIYLKSRYPKISFNFQMNSFMKNIDKKLENIVIKNLILEAFLYNYIEFKYEKRTQKHIDKNLLWSTYEQDSIPNKNSSINDLARRKEFILIRDKNLCNRCGCSIKKESSTLLKIKEIEDGGTYHFENLTVLCHDCNKIQKSNNSRTVLKDLSIYEILLTKYIK